MIEISNNRRFKAVLLFFLFKINTYSFHCSKFRNYIVIPVRPARQPNFFFSTVHFGDVVPENLFYELMYCKICK